MLYIPTLTLKKVKDAAPVATCRSAGSPPLSVFILTVTVVKKGRKKKKKNLRARHDRNKTAPCGMIKVFETELNWVANLRNISVLLQVDPNISNSENS